MKSYTANRPQNTNCSNGTNKDEVLQLRATIGEMKSEINGLKSTIEELKATISFITSNLNCSTDIEIEKDREIGITVYEKESNEVHSNHEGCVAVMTAENNPISNDTLHFYPIDDLDENTNIETWAEQYGNNTVYNNTSNFKEWNAEITEAFKKLEENITMLFHSRTESESMKLQTKIEETFKWCNDNRDKFTEKQFKKVQVQCRRWQSVTNAKVRYFKNGNSKRQIIQKYNESHIAPSSERLHEYADNIQQPLAPFSDNEAVTDTLNNAECMDGVGNSVEKEICSLAIGEFPLDETTLCFERMTDKQRKYFTASPYELKEESEPIRYIHAYKWLRNADDADSLFNTFHEKVIAIVGKDIDAQERYINEWNRYCKHTA